MESCKNCRHNTIKYTTICNKCFAFSQLRTNWQPKEDKMEYKLIKTVNAETILAHKPCRHEYADYIKTFGFSEAALYELIRWAEKRGNIQWLIDKGFIKGFIEKVEPEMLPCPFCGGKVEVVNWDGDYWTECSGHPCPSRSHYKTKTDAADAWNRRV